MVCRLGRPWATGLGAKPAKTRILARFFAAEGQASEYGGRLPSDCAADMRLPQVASWHRAWLTPLASASIKQLKTGIPERFLHRGGPREMRGKEPRCRRSLATEMAPGGGGGDGRAQNRPKLEFWRLFATGYLFKSSRTQDGHAHREYFDPASSRVHTATTTLHRTARKSRVAAA